MGTRISFEIKRKGQVMVEFKVGDRVLVNTHVKQKGTIIECDNNFYKVKLDNAYRWYYLFERDGYKDINHINCYAEDMGLIVELTSE